MMSSLLQDVRYALRGMARAPGFTAVILATVALGIAANAVILSAVNGVLLRPLPYAAPERLVALRQLDPYSSVSEPEFMDYRRDAHAFERLAAYAGQDANLTGDGEPERVQVARVSDGFFTTLGAPARVGRTFTADEEAPAGGPVAVISYGLWQRRFGGDGGVVGRTLVLNGTPRVIVGVMPQRFDYPEPTVAVWVPLRLNPDSLWTRNNHYLSVIGRLKPSATVQSTGAEVATLARRWKRDYPDVYFPDKPFEARVVPLADTLVGATRPYLLALLGAVGFVLLIACANVANLLLARGEARRKDLAIRTALGASRRRLARQALTESAMLALFGGVLGLVLAWWGGRVVLAVAPSSIPRLDQVRLDLPVVAFTFALSLATGLLFGLVPALRAPRDDAAESLKEGGKTSARGAGARTARGALVVAEVALAVVTLSGAGLMVRSLWKLQAIDLGLDPSRLLTMQVSLPAQGYEDARAVEFYRALTERVAAVAGVRAAAAVGSLPISGDNGSRWSIMVDGRVAKSISEAPFAMPQQVTPDYFRTMGIPVLRGRGLTAADRADAPAVVVVNETLARQLWPGQDPVGRTLKMFQDSAPWATVVGVVRDVRSSGLLEDVPPTMFFPHAQAGRSAYYTPRTMSLVVRTAGDPASVAGAARAAVRALDGNAPVTEVASMKDVVAGSVASRRFVTGLLAGFAALAVVLAGIGIYGVIAYGVSQRTYEIGLRMALGAQRGSVMALVLGQGLRMTLVGLALGLAGALAVARALRSLLVGLPAVDLPTLGFVAAALAAVALLASALPARRAMGVEPTEALRGG